MTRLLELQRRFQAALLEEEDAGLEELTAAEGLGPASRLRIHRNNVRLLLIETLRSNFPATCRMVGEEFFSGAALKFIRAQPPRQPRLAEYGAAFASFLAGFAPAAALPWLADLARLEWAMLECQEAEDAPALAAFGLAGLPTERIPHLRFVAHPACRLLASAWPVDRIRSFALDAGQPPAIARDPARLLIRRTGSGIALRRLAQGEFRLLQQLLAGAALGEALEDGQADSAAVLAGALADGLFSALAPAP
jgi:hypothetical protein